MTKKIRDHWLRLPVPVRRFAIDAVEGAVAIIVVLNLVIPSTLAEAAAQAAIVATAVALPVTAAFRRHVVPWLVRVLAETFPRPA